ALVTAITASSLFSLRDPAPTAFYSLSLHDALPISSSRWRRPRRRYRIPRHSAGASLKQRRRGQRVQHRACIPRHSAGASLKPDRSEEHTSELQSRFDLVCRLLLEKKKTHTRETKDC